MSTNIFQKLANRGNSILKEWNSYENISKNSKLMLTEIAASTIVNLCKDHFHKWSLKEQEDKTNFLRIALQSAYQIGRNSRE